MSKLFPNAVTEGPMDGPIEELPADIGPVQADPVHRTEKVSDVPDGTIAEVEEWVSGDRARAEAALKAEQKKKTADQRSGLISSLERLINLDTGAGVASGEA